MVETGPAFIKRQDLIFSPFIYNDASLLSIGIRYTHTGKLKQEVTLRFSGYEATVNGEYEYLSDGEPVSSYPHTFFLVDANYSVTKKMFSNEKMELYAGGTFANDVDALNYYYGFAGYFGYFATFGLDLSGSYTYHLNERSRFDAAVSIPLLSLVARSPYLVNDDEFMYNSYSHNGLKTFFAYLGDGSFQTVNHLQKITMDLAYNYKLSQHWELGFVYGFDFTHYSPVASFTSIENKLHVSAQFNF